MLQVKAALQSTSSHGLSRMVTDKPLYVRIAWLLLYLLMLGLFLNGFAEFVKKLRSRQVSTSIDADEVEFQFPDVYACMENPISASYSSNINENLRRSLEAELNSSATTIKNAVNNETVNNPLLFLLSFLIPPSLPYKLVVESLAHRTRQSVLESYVVYKSSTGLPSIQLLQPMSFYDRTHLRCSKVTLNSTLQAKLLRSASSSGIVLTMFIDSAVPETVHWNSSVASNVYYYGGIQIPVVDWRMQFAEMLTVDRRTGVKIFLTQPGEYPTDFSASVSLAPGKFHTVEIDMKQQVYKTSDFDDCLNETPDVQFVNPYDQTPYSHTYSYSYCYYYEYHRQFQTIMNVSGNLSPMPWPLRGKSYLTQVSNIPLIFQNGSKEEQERIDRIDQTTRDLCRSKRPCSSLRYRASISSSSWPSTSSLPIFINNVVSGTWQLAMYNGESVPALNFMLSANLSVVTPYAKENMLKVLLKPAHVFCDRVTFSRDYGAQNFISDVGGIMGIYLGMSLLTVCEVFELIFDLLYNCKSRKNVGVDDVSLGTNVASEETG